MKDCPDLAGMSCDQRTEFWSKNDPRELRRLGDRLLAESLPREATSRPREELSQACLRGREEAGWSRGAVAKLLGVTESVLEAWENDRVKAPDSLPLILERLVALGFHEE